MALGVALGLCWGLLWAAGAGGSHRWAVLVQATTGEDGSHWYTMTGQLDDLKMLDYSTASRAVKPSRAWMVEAVGATYFREKTQDFLQHEKNSKVATSHWLRLNNHTHGIHMMQVHVGCTMDGDTPVGGTFQYAYDGDDFLSFDAKRLTWVAAVQPAWVQKHLWDAGQDWWDTSVNWSRYAQWYLQHECLETLRSLVRRGKEILERQVPPVVSVSRRDTPDGSVTLSCCARGFHPRPIHVSWVRGGEDVLAETDSSGILPNADGTYYTQSSLEISPQQEDRHRYACRVEHSSFSEPTLTWAPGKKGPLSPGVLAAIVLAVLVLAGALGASVILWRKQSTGPPKPGYAPAATATGEDSGAGADPRV